MPCILLLSSLADYLEIDQSAYPLCRNPQFTVIVSNIFALSLFLLLFVDDHLFQRHEMKLRTGKFGMMLFGTKFTRIYLELVDVSSIFIPHEAKMMVIHLWFLQIFDQIVILQIVYYWIFKRLYFINRSFSCQKLKTQKKRLLHVHHFDPVDYHIVEIAVSALRSKTYLTLTQN